MTKIIVMLMWVGGYHGGPANITGFETMEACQEAIPIVHEVYEKNGGNISSQKCVELPRGAKP